MTTWRWPTAALFCTRRGLPADERGHRLGHRYGQVRASNYDSQNGLPGNIGFEQCKIPTYLDVPSTMAWDAVDLPEPQNPGFGTRGIGEPPQGAAAAALSVRSRTLWGARIRAHAKRA
ncbi:MAG: hypothetical protein CM1200mP36_01230 [Gammaproteobacteria bacterium]|nr:MAG: hypothetical protein CM1200mP36_01230 [Gammaproteobacteria bacterium]